MPELPEAETLVREIRAALEGRHIDKVIVHDHRVLEIPAEWFRRRVRGQRVERVWRRGKWVILTLGSGSSILIQLRMTGQVRLAAPPGGTDYVRLRLPLREGGQLWYCDTRCLGRITALGPRELAERLSEAHLGPEALEISLAELSRRLDRTRRSIKSSLLDQRLLAGIGNLYADEILFHSRLSPERRAADLTAAEKRRLHQAIRKVLQAAIAQRGSTLRDGRYRTADGRPGHFQLQHQVYGRAGQPCHRCGCVIQRKRVRGLINRSSYFCPTCQADPSPI